MGHFARRQLENETLTLLAHRRQLFQQTGRLRLAQRGVAIESREGSRREMRTGGLAAAAFVPKAYPAAARRGRDGGRVTLAELIDHDRDRRIPEGDAHRFEQN